MEYKDYYKILGVARSADDKASKAAYRRLARKYHPDVNKGQAERFKEINEAYAVLSDAEKRKRYDTLGPDWERYARAGAGAGARSPFEGQEVRFGGGDAGGFSDFFRSIFGDLIGGARGRGGFSEVEFGDLGDLGGAEWSAGGFGAGKGSDAEAAIELTLEEAFRGTRKTIALELDEPCKACGFERKGDDLYVNLPVPVTDAALGAEVSVPTLKGQVSMKIPSETSSGRVFRLPGYGMPHLKGGGAGDQYVRVEIALPARLTSREKELFRELRTLRAESSG